MWIINFFKNLKNLIFGKRKAIVPDEPGLIESLLDYRDVPLTAVKKEFAPRPDKYRIPYNLTITNQGNTPHCVGHACATIKEFLEMREGNDIKFDGDWIYNECKKIDGIPDVKGTYFRTGLKVLQKIGAMPIGGGDPSKYRIGGYARVDCEFNTLKQAIYEFGAIFVGFRGSNGGWKTAFIRKPKSGEREWGHATTGVRYEITYIDGQNSWGENWGDEGLFHFTKDYKPIEVWCVLVDLPNNWKELLGEDKTKPKHSFKNNLYHGLASPDVIILQRCYKYLGCMPMEVEESEHFGPKTLEASKIFQQRYNISPVKGYVGPLTRAKLNELFNN